MKIQAALLCDAANVRDGLLNVLSAGITRVWRESLPAPVNLAIGVLLDIPPSAALRPHEIHLVLQNPSGDKVVEAMGGFQTAGLPDLKPGEHAIAPFVLPFNFQATEYGEHRARLTIDKDATTETVRFWVAHPQERIKPPTDN